MRNGRNTELKWPDYYPENCPPEDAKPASGIVYRLVKQDPVQQEDFIPLITENPKRFENKPNAQICKGCGISVCKGMQDILKLQRSSGKMRKRQIAEGELSSTLGVIKHTPSRNYKTHHTWWVDPKAKPWHVFKVIAE